MKVRLLHPQCHCEPTLGRRGNPFLTPFPKGGLRGIFLFVITRQRSPAGNLGEYLGMPGESTTGKGLHGLSIAISMGTDEITFLSYFTILTFLPKESEYVPS
jgi:hypothetical protein